jgi:quinolinate synthase
MLAEVPMRDVAAVIEQIRGEWGSRLLILGHHYQEPSVLRHADVIGDSLELSRKAGAAAAERIVFCGVHFMAESADILTSPRQTVYMPETAAGCPMADMATIEQVGRAWTFLQAHGQDWLPVVYVNSSALVKAFCGRQGGSTCTSSNAVRVFAWVFSQHRRVFFLPDQHLGANSAHDLGVPDEAVVVFDPRRPEGGLSAADLARARIVVWGGYCPIHVVYTADLVRRVREAWPGARIIVHPEAPKEVVRLADAHGSTSQIVEYVRTAPTGATIIIGTESHLVRRLAEEHHGRLTIKSLTPSFCPNMAKTNERNLLALLREWPARHIIRVAPEVAADARLALERMLAR